MIQNSQSSPLKIHNVKNERHHSSSPQNQNDMFFQSGKLQNLSYLDIIRKRLKIPLAELLNRMAEAKEYLPIIKVMPKKVSDVELSIFELRDLLRSQYVTYTQLQIVNGTFKSDIDQLMENTTAQTIRKVIQIIDDKVPFEYLAELMKNKASFDQFKHQEKELLRVSADLERLMNRFGMIEMDHRRQTNVFDGVSREDVENMIRYKVEKAENDRRIAEIELRIGSLRKVMDSEIQTKNDMFKKIEKSIHEIDEQSQSQLKEKFQQGELERQIKQLMDKQSLNEYRLNEVGRKFMDFQDEIQQQLSDVQTSKIDVLGENMTQKFNDFDDKLMKLKNIIQQNMEMMNSQLLNSIDEANLRSMHDYLSKMELMNKRMMANEVTMKEMVQENQQLRSFKQRQLEVLGEQVQNCENMINQKFTLRLSQLEKDFGISMTVLNERLVTLEDEFTQIRGPLLDEFNRIRNESSGLLRELERQQGNYRELIADYVKTLDAKLQQLVIHPSQFLGDLETQDDLVRNSTKLKLKKQNHDGILSNQNMLASVINQQLLNTNSLLSLGSSELSNYLKSNKFLYQQHLKKHLRQQSQIPSVQKLDQQVTFQNNNSQQNVHQKSNNLSSPQSERSQQQILQQRQTQVQDNGQSPLSLSLISINNQIVEDASRYKLKIRTQSGARSATHTKRRNNSSIITSYLQNQNNSNNNSQLVDSEYQMNRGIHTGQTSKISNQQLQNDQKGPFFENENQLATVPIGGDYSTLLNNVANLKRKKQQQKLQLNKSLQQRKKNGARTTLNSSLDINSYSPKKIAELNKRSPISSGLQTHAHTQPDDRTMSNNPAGYVSQLKDSMRNSQLETPNIPPNFMKLKDAIVSLDENQTDATSLKHLDVKHPQTVTSQMYELEEKKQKRMLEKNLPITLHRFSHLMKDTKTQ
ncbi:UNKNOWN [Stylonychia lemnae]|uniref:Uncharacterized protein n=1 Tax=Stylonychia lemnae TaxID=5949 RepID=A0A078ARD5_STYLE|nr:UNKNOWN [Stylonychia lemnae]|eukprot:CDW85010.1 UNKNOWN [Stylonychia lemnae]